MAKKTVSQWKKKKAYSVLAPDNFDGKPMGVTVAYSPDQIPGRTIQTSLSELTGDRSKQHLKLTFEINRVVGDNAHTVFKKFTIPTGYLRYKIRKGNTKVDYINDITFSGTKARVKIMVLSRWRMSESQAKLVRQVVDEVIRRHAGSDINQVVQMTLFGKLGTEIYKKARKITPITRVEVYHISLLRK